MDNRIITIEGNIGSGKSTLLAALKNYYKYNNDIVWLREPVDIWESIKDENGATMLQKFYGDQQKYSFPFQMLAFGSRLKLLKEAIKNNPNKVLITERSLYTDKFVFAKMLHDMKNIESVNYQIYCTWFDIFSEECPLHQCIYVKTEPTICHERIEKRSRTGEESIPLDYLVNCNTYHEAMMETITPMFENKEHDILTLDGNVNIYEEPSILEEWIKKIDALIYV